MKAVVSQGPRVGGFPFIEVLRAVAALLVLVYHVIEVGHWRLFPTGSPWRTFRIGWIGVDLFLVISGFVISHSALRDYARSPVGARRRFMERRLVRIVPLYILTNVVYILLCTPGILAWDATTMLLHFGAHALFIHNLFVPTHGSINGVNWSVGLEMQFYLLIALFMPWLARARAHTVLLLLVAVAVGYRYLTTIFWPFGSVSVSEQFIRASQLPGTLDAFGFGMAIAIVQNRGPDLLKRALLPSWRNFAIWSALSAVVLSLAMDSFWPRAGYYDHPMMVTFWRTLLEAGFAALLAAAITFPAASAGVFAPFRYLGDVSYGIYLWHMMVLRSIDPLPDMAGYRLLRWTLLGTLALAAICWHWLEKPMLERVRARR